MPQSNAYNDSLFNACNSIEAGTILYMRKLSLRFPRKAPRTKATKNKSKSSFSLRNSFRKRTEHWNFKKLTVYFTSFAIVLALATSWLWYTNLYMTPERRFWIAINNSLATPSVVRTLTQGGSGNQVVQDYRYHFAPQRAVENVVDFSERSATMNTSVRTEGILFPTEQYLRYTDFSNATTNANDLSLDEVLGIWAFEEAEDDEQAELNYLSEQVSIALFGNFDAQFRDELLSEMKNRDVYSGDFNQARDVIQDGERVFVYVVNVKLKVYAELLNRSFERAGYGDFPALNPENYRDDAVLTANFSVRKKDNTIRGINFGGRDEVYSNYGIVRQVEAPDAQISIQELQTRVQALFQAQQN